MQEETDLKQQHLYDEGSAYDYSSEGLKKSLRAEIYSRGGARDTITLDPDRYETLLGSLQALIDRLEDVISTQRSKPGSRSVFKGRIAKLEKQRDQTIDLLCIFDI